MASRATPSHFEHQATAKAQLTLVEHALCPLDSARSLKAGLIHETHYYYTDKHRNRRLATARIGALDGLSASDELYLWGLLSLALSQPEAGNELMATPYYCLRELGIVTADKRGGREFVLFRQALRRLAAVRYQSDRFWDPVRGEHRDVSFGFLSYSLPLDPLSKRAWRFVFDPLFFELARATGGVLRFDMGLYRRLSPAARRLYLFLKKIFWREQTSPSLELRHLAVDVLGFSPDLATRRLKEKVAAAIAALADEGVLASHHAVSSAIVRRAKGDFRITVARGPHFDEIPATTTSADSSLTDLLHAIGLELPTIRRVVRTYSSRLIETWADITLAARERHGEKFFKRSAAAYFLDNLKHAAKGSRTAPDWWHDLQRQERRQLEEQEQRRGGSDPDALEKREFDEYLRTEARAAFEQTMQKLRSELERAGQSAAEARRNAEYHSRIHLLNRFRRDRAAGRPGTL